MWSLLIPSMDMASDMEKLAFIPAAVGLMLGVLFLLLMDRVIPHLHMGATKAEGPENFFKKNNHACPGSDPSQYSEGMAVGRSFCRNAYQ